MSINSDALHSSDTAPQVWTSAVGSDIDIVATYGSMARALRIGRGGGGTLVFVDGAGVTQTWTNLQDAEVLTLKVRKLVASGSTAYAIGLYI